MSSFDRALGDELRVRLQEHIQFHVNNVTQEAWGMSHDHGAYLLTVGRITAFREAVDLIDEVEREIMKR